MSASNSDASSDAIALHVTRAARMQRLKWSSAVVNHARLGLSVSGSRTMKLSFVESISTTSPGRLVNSAIGGARCGPLVGATSYGAMSGQLGDESDMPV
jgi:hypothetical protein